MDIVSVSWGVKFKNWVLSAEFTQNNFIFYPQGALHLACSRLQNCKAKSDARNARVPFYSPPPPFPDGARRKVMLHGTIRNLRRRRNSTSVSHVCEETPWSEKSFAFSFNLIDISTMAFSTGQSWHVLASHADTFRVRHAFLHHEGGLLHEPKECLWRRLGAYSNPGTRVGPRTRISSLFRRRT